MTKLFKTIALMIAALAGIGMLSAATKPKATLAPAAKNWNATVSKTAKGGYLLGNPDAPVKLVAYISYTCPHCAHFEQESDAQLRIGMIGPGKGSLEVRPFLRNMLDVTVSLLTECGPPTKFYGNHAAFLSSQQQWMAPVQSLTEAQKARWNNPDFGARMRAVASDLKFYDIMEKRGYGRAEVDRCLSNRALGDQLAQQTQAAVENDNVQGTPSFVLDGVPLAGTYDWASLKPQVEARLR